MGFNEFRGIRTVDWFKVFEGERRDFSPVEKIEAGFYGT